MGWADGRSGGQAVGSLGRVSSDRLTSPIARPPDRPTAAALRTALIPAPAVDVLDPTGCGDVFGAAAARAPVRGRSVEAAIRHANGDGRAERRASAAPVGSRATSAASW